MPSHCNNPDCPDCRHDRLFDLKQPFHGLPPIAPTPEARERIVAGVQRRVEAERRDTRVPFITKVRNWIYRMFF